VNRVQLRAFGFLGWLRNARQSYALPELSGESGGEAERFGGAMGGNFNWLDLMIARTLAALVAAWLIAFPVFWVWAALF
jgi:hypothetical protein